MAKSKRKPEHYVNNKEFTAAVHDYVLEVQAAEKEGREPPTIPPYIGDCFIRIVEGLSHSPNFASYTWRDEMVGDGIENCVKAAAKFKINAETRSGNPNAFGYFTKIAYWAFLRRIAKEKKQQETKNLIIEQGDFSGFAGEDSNHDHDAEYNSFVEQIRSRRRNNS
jgi:hypothetical protein